MLRLTLWSGCSSGSMVYMHAPPDIVELLHQNQSFDLRQTLWSDRLPLCACLVRGPRIYCCGPRDCLMFSLIRLVHCSIKPFVMRWQTMF